MHETILLVAHGSRAPTAHQELTTLVSKWCQHHPDKHIELCALEFSEARLDAGLDTAAASATSVVVIPLMLGAAGHVKNDIPQHLARARQRHPDTTFILAPHLGANLGMLPVLRARLAQAIARTPATPATTAAILLARGSSDAEANAEHRNITRALLGSSGLAMAGFAFSDLALPSLETTVQHQIDCGMTSLIILPYYLFHGVLLQRTKEQVNRLQWRYPHITIHLAQHLAGDPNIYALLDQRLAAAQTES